MRQRGRRVKKDTATERIRKCIAMEKDRLLGNDPKVGLSIKQRWLPVTNLAPVSIRKPRWGHFPGA